MIRSAFELTSNTVEWCARLSDHSPKSFVLGEDFDAEFSGKGRRQRIDFASGNILSKASPDNASYVQWILFNAPGYRQGEFELQDQPEWERGCGLSPSRT